MSEDATHPNDAPTPGTAPETAPGTATGTATGATANTSGGETCGVRRLLWSIATGALSHIAVLAIVGLIALPWVAVPLFRQVFEDFDSELPAVTVWLLQLPAVPATVVLGLWLVGLIAVEVLVKSGPARLVVVLLSLLLSVLLLAGSIVALAVPMLRLAYGVGG